MRCFFCIELDPPTREQLAQVIQRLRSAPAQVRWVEPALLHVTLKFLGEIDAGRIPALQAIVRQVVAPCAPFALTLDRVGAFPHLDRARVIWAGAGHTPAPLASMAAAFEEALCEVGFAKEQKPFTAHVTLGRVREEQASSLRALGERLRAAALAPMAVKVEGITLMQSVLRPQGPTYTPVFTVGFDRRNSADQKPIRLKTVGGNGPQRGVDLDNTAELLDQIEPEAGPR